MDLLFKFKEYLFSQEDQPARVTVKNYLSDVNHFVKWVQAQTNSSFTPSQVNPILLDAYKKDNSTAFSQSSMQRHLSSLRKFFKFLKIKNLITSDPFEFEQTASTEARTLSDPWKLKDFKNNLYVGKAAHLTIKNYIIDIKQFIAWARETSGIPEDLLITRINKEFVGDYKAKLMENAGFSPATVNRKLSSLRRYLSWAHDQGMITENTLSVENINEAKPKLYIPNPSEYGQIHPNLAIGENGQSSTVDRQSYSGFPPLRLMQKISDAGLLALDSTLIAPLATLALKGQTALWKIKGKPIFEKGPKTFVMKNITHEDLLGIKNISKKIYAPLGLSTKSFSPIQKLIFKLRYTRPNWYKRYHSYAITHYFHFAVLIIVIVGLAIGFYNGFVKNSGSGLAVNPNLPTAPNRILSFQGRLTDNNDNPITSVTNLRFSVYTGPVGTGAAVLLWQEVDQVSPDSDGIFNTLLGNSSTNCGSALTIATGKCAIPSSLFSENNTLFLGVAVESTSELGPRQQIATVAFAANSETLQGLPPITATSSGTTNVVLALDSSGNLTIGGTAAPVFSASGGQFKLSGQPLLLTTNGGSNGNVVLSPDGIGKIDLQKALQNNTLSTNIRSSGGVFTAAGAVEVDDLFAVLATSSGQSAFTLNQDSTGPLISASASGVSKFTIDNSGNQTLAGNLTAAGTTGISLSGNGAGITFSGTGNHDIAASSGTLRLGALALTGAITGGGQDITGLGALSAAGTVTFSGYNANNNVLYATVTTGIVAGANTNTTGLCLTSGATNPIWGSCATGTATNWWTTSADGKALTPINSTMDLLIGGTSTASAEFAFTGMSSLSHQTQASFSGNLIIMPNNGYGGRVGIGTTAPGSPLHINSTSASSVTLATIESDINGIGEYNEILFNVVGGLNYGAIRNYIGAAAQGDLAFFGATSNVLSAEVMRITGTGNVGIGTTAPRAALDITGDASISANLFFDGAGTTHTIGYLDNGNINFQKYPSGNGGNNTSVMYLSNSGNVGIGDTSPSKMFVVGNGDLFQVDSGGNALAPTLALGTGTIARTDRLFDFNDSTTLTSGTTYTGTNQRTLTGTLTGDATSYGLYNTLTINATESNLYSHVARALVSTAALSNGNTIDTLNSGYFLSANNSTTLSTFGNTATTSAGISTAAYNNGADSIVTNQYGTLSDSYNQADRAVNTNQYGLLARSYTSTANEGYVTNSYGVMGQSFENVVHAGGSGITTGYGGYFTSQDATTSAGLYALGAQNSTLTESFTNLYGVQSNCQANGANITVTNCYGIYSQILGTAGTINNSYGMYIDNPTSTGTVTTNYGLFIADQTGGDTSDYGIAIAGADTQALWISSAVDTTDAANGIAFGLSRDTNLYRSAANTLKTDDSLTVAGSTVTFSGYNANNNVLYATVTTGVVAGANTNTTGQCLISGASAPIWTSCSSASNNYWQLNLGAIAPFSEKADVLIGDSATASAEFAFTGLSSLTHQTQASFSGNLIVMSNNGYGGNVGIGTTAPTSMLHLSAPGANGSITLNIQADSDNANDNADAILQFSGDGGANSASVWFDNTANDLVLTNNSTGGDILLTKASTGHIQLMPGNGYVGVNTLTPSAMLDITGSASVSANLGFRGAATAHTLNIFDNGTLNIQRSPSGDAGLATTLFIQNNGNVGIGTTGPDSPLDVLSTGGSQIRATYTDGTVYTTFNTDSAGDLTIDGTGTKSIIADDLQVTGNDILDSGAATRITLGATTTLTNTTTTLSGTSTLTASSLATFTTAATLGMSSTTTLNLGTNATLNAGATALNLQAEGAVDVNIAGGSGTTGCTITNSTGALSCTGNITSVNGIVGFWQRNLGAISPTNITDDLLIGGVSTTSADFAFTGMASPLHQTQASISGQLIVMPNNGYSGRVGIGTINPAAKLEIDESNIATTYPLLLSNPINGTNIASVGASFSAHGRTFAQIVGGQQTNGTYADGTLAFYTEVGNAMPTNPQMLIQGSTGNVGIGTTNPASKLEIQDTDRTAVSFNSTPTMDLFVNTSTSGEGSVFSFSNLQGGSRVNSVALVGKRVTNGGQFEIWTKDTATGPLMQRLTIIDGGNVGIGTTGPDSPLDVLSTGGSQIRATYTDGTVYTTFNTDSAGDLTIDGTGTKSIIADDLQVTGNDILDSGAATRITLGATTTLTNTTTTLSGTSTLTASTLATLTTAASLGVSATTLTLGNGSAATITTTTNGLTLDSGSNTLTIAASDTTLTASGLTTFTTTATLGMTSTTTLNLGTNATLSSNATALNLEENGGVDVNIAGTSASTGCTVTNSTGALACAGNITGPATGTIGYWQRNGTSLAPATIGDYVGIGNTTPRAALDITGDASISANLFFDGASTTHTIGYLDNGNINFQKYPSGNGGNNSTVLYLSNGGNVGIGTTIPAAKLQVGLKVSDDNSFAYDSNSLMVIHQTPTATATLNDPKTVLTLARQGTSGQAYGAGATFNLSRYENNSVNSRTRLDISLAHASFDITSNNVMTLLSSGNVGIGTTAPVSQLEIVGAGQTTTALTDAGAMGSTILLQSSDGSVGSGGAIVFGAGADRFAAIKAYYADGTANGVGYLAFSTRNATSDTALTERMIILNGGNIGIGDSSPSKLFVVGNGDLFQVDSSGNAKAPTLALGNGTIAPTDRLFDFNDTSSDINTGLYTGTVQKTITGTITANRTNYGLYNVVTVNSSDNMFSSTVTGTYSQTTLPAGYTADTIYGLQGVLVISSSTLAPDTGLTATNSAGLYGTSSITGAATVSNNYGTLSTGVVSGAATVANNIGIYSLAQASNASAVVSANDAGRFIAYDTVDGTTVTTSRGIYAQSYENGNYVTNGIVNGYGGYFTSQDAITTYGVYALGVQNSGNTETFTSVFGTESMCQANSATITITNCYGIYAQNLGTAGTITNSYGMYVASPSTTGTVTTNYGLYIADQTGGDTSDYGIAIAGADTQALWIGSGADNTDAANGIAFGLSLDTNLYRSAANTLKTDDAFSTGGLITGTAGLTITGAAINLNVSSNFATNINTGTSTGAVTIGGGSGTVAITSTALDVTTLGAVSGVTTLTSSGSTTLGTGASSANTMGAGASSTNIIGSVTTPGALTLHGATTLDNTFTVSGSNLTSLGGNLTVTGTTWTATPTISGLITATSGLTSNGTLTANGIVTLGDNGDTVAINSNDWDIDTAGNMSGIGTIAANGKYTNSAGGEDILLNGATSNRIGWTTTGVAAPTFTTYSAGVKLVLYDNVGAASAGYTIGIEGSTLFQTVDSTASQFKWYGGTTQAMLLSGTGNLTIAGDLAITGGNITTAVTADSTLTTTGTLTANGAFDANGAVTLGDGGDAITIDSNGTLTINDTTITASTLATLTTAATLGMTSTTTLNLGNNATLSSNATALNLEENGGVDVNIAGTSASTGCTVTNSTGALACAGNLTIGGGILQPTFKSFYTTRYGDATVRYHKIASGSISAVNENSAGSVELLQTDLNTPDKARGLLQFALRHNGTGVDPVVEMRLVGHDDTISLSDIVLVVTNNVTTTDYDIYLRSNDAWETWWFQPIITGNGYADSGSDPTWYNDAAGITVLPAGTQYNPTWMDMMAGNLTLNGGTMTLGVDTNVVLTGGVNGISFDTDVLSVDATNNRVGIGTIAPKEALDLAGTLGTTGGNIILGTYSNTVSRYIGMGSGTNGSFAAGSGFSGIEFGGAATGPGEGYIAFHTHDFGVSSAERMRIDKSGNVGIGTTAPDTTVELSGATAPKFSMSDTGLAHGVTTFAATDAFFQVEQVTNDAGGARIWGLSSTVGQNPLRLVGAFGSTDPTDTVPGIWLLAGKKSGTTLTNLGALETVLQVSQSDGTTHLMTILGSGNVGIGTASPNVKLEVNGGVGAANLAGANLLESSTNLGDSSAWTASGVTTSTFADASQIKVLESTSTGVVGNCYDWGYYAKRVKVDPNKKYEFSVWTRQTVGTSGNKYVGFFVYDSSNVQIAGSWGNPYFWAAATSWTDWRKINGFLDPSYVTDATADGISDVQSSKTAGTDWRMPSNAAYVIIRYGYCYSAVAGDKEQFAYPEIREVSPDNNGYGSPLYVDDANRYVGIGTTSPTTYLDGTSGLAVYNATVPGISWGNGSGHWTSYMTGTDLRFYNGAADKVTIQNGGNVGIGTTSPGYNLEVNGTFKSSSLTYTGNLYPGGNTTTYFGWDGSGITKAGTGYFYISTGSFYAQNATILRSSILNDNASTGLQLTDADGAVFGGPLTGISTITTSGLINGQTISSAANFTGSMAIAGSLAANGGITIDGNTVIDDGGGWHRSYGATGWYNGTYGGGMWMQGSTYVEVYGGKSFLVPSGSVGIGTTAPAAKLQLLADVQQTGGDTAQLMVSGATNQLNRLLLGYDTTANVGFIGAVTHGTAWRNISIAALGGNVGIGTTAPGYKLDVSGTVNATGTYNGNSKEIFLTTDSWLRMNQSSTFSSGIWTGSSNIGGGATYWMLGSNGGTTTSNIYLYGGTYDGTNNIALDGSTGNGVFGGAVVTSNAASTWGDLRTGTIDSSIVYAYTNMCVGNASGSCNSTGGTVIGASNSFFMGTVGVGVTSTAYKMEVNGTFYSDNHSFGSTSGPWTMGVTSPCSNTGACWDKGGVAKMGLNTAGVLRVTGAVNQNTAPDMAEYVNILDTSIDSGDIVSSVIYDSTQKNAYAKAIASKTDKKYQPNIVGGISENPGFIAGYNGIDNLDMINHDQRYLTVAGRIPIKVSTINGKVKTGDHVTSSEIPGIGMKATKAGTTLGIALTDYEDGKATQSAKLVNGAWQIQNNACDPNETDCYDYQKVLVLIDLGWNDPDVMLSSTGDLNFVDQTATLDANFTIPHYFTLNDALGNPIDRIGVFGEIAVAKLRAGYVNAQQITTQSLNVATSNVSIAGQSLHDYIASIATEIINSQSSIFNNGIISPLASIDALNTNLISPLAQDSAISLKLENNKLSIINDKSGTGSAVTSFDNAGNATLSGELTSKGINTEDASVSGVLRVRKIIADQIEGLDIKTSTISANYITNNYYTGSSSTFPTLSASPSANGQWSMVNGQSGGYISIASFSSQLAYVENLSGTNALFNQNLTVFGQTTLSDTSIVGQLAVGGNLIINDRSINVLGSDLNLQPLKQGGLSIMGGIIYIDTSGNVKFGSDATVNGTLFANQIAPISGKDLTIKLDSEDANSKLLVKGASGSGIFTLDNLGNIIASGAGTFAKLNLSDIVAPALAVSPTEVIATGSAGTVTLKANRTEITVDNALVTQNSLIYITPIGDTGSQSLYLVRQVPESLTLPGNQGSFTVGISTPIPNDVKFNFLIVN